MVTINEEVYMVTEFLSGGSLLRLLQVSAENFTFETLFDMYNQIM